MIGSMLVKNYGFVLAGTARNGREALEQIPGVKPDVVLLAVEMPVLDGLTTLKRLMRCYRVPVLMLSAHAQKGNAVTVEALTSGAVDFVAKPAQSSGLNAMVATLAAKIRAVTAAPAGRRVPVCRERKQPHNRPAPVVMPRERVRLIVIGSSTGGPAALRVILASLPAGFKAPVIVVQHMPAGFTASLAVNLNARCALTVKQAANGDLITPGEVLIAPAGRAFALHKTPSGVCVTVRESTRPLAPGVFRPSVDEVMIEAAKIYGRHLLGVVLTGMGKDGLKGMRAIKAANGLTIAQEESTCVVYGMPKAVIEAGLADSVVPLPQIGPALVRIAEKM